MTTQGGVLQSTLVNLLEEGFVSLPVIMFTRYKKIGLAEVEIVLLIHLIIFHEKEQVSFPTVAQLSQRMSLSEEVIGNHLQNLVRKGFIAIEEDINECGLRCERYSLWPFRQQLASSFIDREEVISDKQDYDIIFALFEREFARTLSPLECEILVKWTDEDKHSKELIEAALREAVFSDKLSFRYIDRILLDWQRKGISTPKEAAEYSYKFRQNRSSYRSVNDISQDTKKGDFTFYDWVNN